VLSAPRSEVCCIRCICGISGGELVVDVDCDLVWALAFPIPPAAEPPRKKPLPPLESLERINDGGVYRYKEGRWSGSISKDVRHSEHGPAFCTLYTFVTRRTYRQRKGENETKEYKDRHTEY